MRKKIMSGLMSGTAFLLLSLAVVAKPPLESLNPDLTRLGMRVRLSQTELLASTLIRPTFDWALFLNKERMPSSPEIVRHGVTSQRGTAQVCSEMCEHAAAMSSLARYICIAEPLSAACSIATSTATDLAYRCSRCLESPEAPPDN